MSKVIDWEAAYQAPMRGKRGGYASRKEQLAKSFQQLSKQQEEAAQFKRLEPLLRKTLFEYLVSKRPLKVTKPLTYITETLSKSENSTTSSGRFEVSRKLLEPGDTLTFVRTDNTMGQWLFKSSADEWVEIYNSPVIRVDANSAIQNPGFWGLMTCTNVYDDVVQGLGEAS